MLRFELAKPRHSPSPEFSNGEKTVRDIGVATVKVYRDNN